MSRKTHQRTLRSTLAHCILLLGCAAALLSSPAEAGDGTIRKAVHPVKNRYIVKVSDSLAPAAVRSLASTLANQHRGKLDYVWDSVVPSFSVELPEAAAEAISRHPFVDFVEEVAEWKLSQIQFNAPFHLDRIDRRSLADLNGTYEQGCVTTTVYAYVLDTGVRASHHEFWTSSVNSLSRVLPGKDFITPNSPSETNPCSGYTVFDDTTPCPNDRECLGGGHGTAVASVLGGLTYGVAKGVKIIPVRVIGCVGQSPPGTIEKGLEWIYNDKADRNAARIQAGLPIEPAVLNISSGSPVTPGAPETVAEMWINKLITERSITVVVSANNQEVDVARSSPARVPNVITVAGSTNTDKRWHCNSSNTFEVCSAPDVVGSNYGSGVDIFAPAQNIPSAGIKDNLDPNDPLYNFYPCCRDSDTVSRQGHLSGTSFAAPIVAGLAARTLMGSGASLTPAQVWQQILTEASGDQPSTPPAVLQPPNGDPNAGPLLSPNRFIFKQGATRCRSVG